MSNDVQALVWRSEFPSPVAKLIALKLADNSNDDGENIWPSISTVQRMTGLSRSTVCGWLSVFAEVRLVTRVGGVTSKRTAVRRFDMAILAGLADTRRRDGSGAAPRLRWVERGDDFALEELPQPPQIGKPEQNHSQDSPARGLVHHADQSATRTSSVQHADSDGPPRGPKPSMNYQRTALSCAPDARGGSGKRNGNFFSKAEDLLSTVGAANPDRLPIVDNLLAPILAARKLIDCPDPAVALGNLCDRVAAMNLSAADAGEVVERVLASRVEKYPSGVFLRTIEGAINSTFVMREMAAAPVEPQTIPSSRPSRDQIAFVEKKASKLVHVKAGTPEFAAAVERVRLEVDNDHAERLSRMSGFKIEVAP